MINGLIPGYYTGTLSGEVIVRNHKISKYYNKKDFNLANKAISEMKKAKWPSALKIANKAKDKSKGNFQRVLMQNKKIYFICLVMNRYPYSFCCFFYNEKYLLKRIHISHIQSLY